MRTSTYGCRAGTRGRRGVVSHEGFQLELVAPPRHLPGHESEAPPLTGLRVCMDDLIDGEKEAAICFPIDAAVFGGEDPLPKGAVTGNPDYLPEGTGMPAYSPVLAKFYQEIAHPVD